MLDDSKIISSYIPIVDFFADVFGPSCEVLLHDLTQLESSVIYIKNGDLTNRQIGDTITDFGLEILRNIGDYKDKAFVECYIAKSASRTFKSSTFFIRNSEENIIGFLCVNIDISDNYEMLELSKRMLSKLLPNPGPECSPSESPVISENFIINAQALIEKTTNDVLSQFPVDVAHLSMDEKREAVRQLEKRGVFLLKNAVNEIAVKLNTSPQTIYRYLKEIAG